LDVNGYAIFSGGLTTQTGNNAVSINYNDIGLSIGSTADINFRPAGFGTADTGIIRASVGTLKISDSSTGWGTLVAGNIGVGTESPISKFHITGATTGKALTMFDETGDQSIITASASSVTRWTLDRDGSIVQTSADTDGIAYDMTINALTTGKGLSVTSNSTTYSSGNLVNLDWSPTGTTEIYATGDLMRINVGQYGNVGNLLNILDTNSSIFSVSQTAFTTSLPVNFTSPGDVSMAYDVLFTNQTSSFIKTNAPFVIEVGESYESNNLTLRTYNNGNIILENATNGLIATFEGTGNVGIGTNSADFKLHVSDFQAATVAAMIENTAAGTDADALAIKLGFTGGGYASNRYITFLNGVGQIHGSIRSNASRGVTYESSGIDFAEYFVKQDANEYTPTGTIMCQGDNGVKACNNATDASTFVGIVSSAPAVLGGVDGPNKVIVGMMGQVPVRVSSSSQNINYGDYLTFSPASGVAEKATKPGFMVGRTLESWTGGSGQETVNVLITNFWADPIGALAFTSEGDLDLSGDNLIRALTSQTLTLAAEQDALRVDLGILDEKIASMAAMLASNSAAMNVVMSGLREEASPSATPEAPIVDVITTFMKSITIKGEALIEGVLTVLGKATFKNTVTFEDSITFPNNSAGTIVVPSYITKVPVTFEKPFATPPIVTLTLSLRQATDSAFLGDAKAAVADVTPQGFVLVLDSPVPRELMYNWVAITVANANQTVGPSLSLDILLASPSVSSSGTVAGSSTEASGSALP